jgi:hypothetical protein
MIAVSHKPAEPEGTRWKAVRLGLRLANSYLGAGMIVWVYALWVLIGLILCVVLIPFAVLGKVDVFKNALNPFALYGFLLPMALTAAITWAVKLFSRLLWCGIPEPLTARFLALASVVGRLSVLFALGHVWLSREPFGKGLLLPATIACSGIAWLGLVAEWGFIRTLRRDFIPAADPVLSSDELDKAVEDATEAEGVTEQNKKSIFTFTSDDVGDWFKRHFPRGYKFVVWILLPVAYATVSSLADNGDPRAIPSAILRLAVIAPAFLQIFWIPGHEIDRLINAFSQKTAQENFHST